MADGIHPLAPHSLPAFVPGPDGSDPLFTAVIILVVVLVFVLGASYFWLHALPEKMAHKANSAQYQLTAVFALLALFTHDSIFWVLALVLAVLRFPDVTTPLRSIAQSLQELKNRER